MNEGKLTIFLSHSHKDVEKVRKIRDILEILNCEPLMFFMKCLDDNNVELEDFIKREIEARNIFLYCKSENSEKSEWVQRELEYIRSFDEKRLYEIDIETGFNIGIINLLICIQNIIKSNKVFIVGSEIDKNIMHVISEYLTEKGMLTTGEDLKEKIGLSNIEKLVKNIDEVINEGRFIFLCTPNIINSKMSLHIIEKVITEKGEYILVKLKGDKKIYDSLELNFYLGDNLKKCIEIDKDITDDQLKEIYKKLKR